MGSNYRFLCTLQSPVLLYSTFAVVQASNKLKIISTIIFRGQIIIKAITEQLKGDLQVSLFYSTSQFLSA